MQPLLLNTNDAAALCGVTVKRWRTWNSLGKIPAPIRIGKGLFWKHDELKQWIEADCPVRKHWIVSIENRKNNSQKRPSQGLPNPQKRGKV